MTIPELYQIYLQYPSVQTDTRRLTAGDIYFALKGPSFDGNRFAADALGMGAAYAVIDDPTYAVNDKCILVTDVLLALQQLAAHHRQQFSIPFIAITGSNGKTTTKELILAALKQQYVTYATEGNLNNHIGVPLTLLKIKSDAQMAIIEMGANHQKEIEAYCKIAMPTHALITNCGKAHIEGFGGVEGIRKGKGELYVYIREHNGTIFINTDLPYLDDMAKGISNRVTYGNANAEYIGRPVMEGVLLQVAILTANAETTIHTNLVGTYNFPNVMAAVAIGRHFGISIDKIRTAIEAYQPDNSRSQWLQKGTNKVILDAYNANPTSMHAAITNFAGIGMPHKMLWIGGMKEMGAEEQAEHMALVALIAQYQWDGVVLVGKELEPFKDKHTWFATSADAAAWVKEHQPQNSSILIKGSRGSKMEVLLEAI